MALEATRIVQHSLGLANAARAVGDYFSRDATVARAVLQGRVLGLLTRFPRIVVVRLHRSLTLG